MLLEGEPIAHVAFLQAYEDIFIKVKDWNKYKRSDMARNQIRGAEDMANIPNFVQAFEQKLVREPRLDPDVRCFFDLSVCGSILTDQCRCRLYCRN